MGLAHGWTMRKGEIIIMNTPKNNPKKERPAATVTVVFTLVFVAGMLLTIQAAKWLSLDKNVTLIVEVIALLVFAVAANFISKWFGKKFL